MRDLDAFCLTPVAPMSGAEIQALRAREGVGQAVLAAPPERRGQAGLRLGTRREAAEWPIAEAARARADQGAQRHHLRPAPTAAGLSCPAGSTGK